MSCTNLSTRNEFEVKLSEKDIDEYIIQIILRGPLKFDLETSVFNFLDNQILINGVKNINDSLNYNKPILFLENEDGSFRPFSQMPTNVVFDFDTSYYLQKKRDTIYKIDLIEGEELKFMINKTFSVSHFKFSGKSSSNKVRLYYLPKSSTTKVLKSNWFVIPR